MMLEKIIITRNEIIIEIALITLSSPASPPVRGSNWPNDKNHAIVNDLYTSEKSLDALVSKRDRFGASLSLKPGYVPFP